MKKVIFSLLLTAVTLFLWIAPMHAETAAVVEVDVEYNYDMARSMLDGVNAFRTSDTWYWDNTDTNKIPVTGLSGLIYDSELEKTAMQRAAELAVMFSHTRPDGSRCFDAFPSVNAYMAENIAVGFTSASGVLNAWREEDKNYAGQGHRRAMLNSNLKYIGIGCVYADGIYYWAQSFSGVPGASPAGTPSPARVSISSDRLENYMRNASVGSASLSIQVGESADLPSISAICDNNFTSVPVRVVSAPWQASGDAIAVSGGAVSGNQAGTGTASVNVGSKTIQVTVTVTDGSAPSVPSHPGDANGDGEVDIVDAMLVLRSTCGWAVDIDPANCDVNADGEVDIIDATMILRFTCGWDVTLQ